MRYEVYTEIKIANGYEVFEFVSIGKNGAIPKRIEFTATDLPNVVNLAFGDIGSDGEIDDYSISDNGNRNKILATIASAVEIYLNMNPYKLVYFKGSTEERTRLYRIAVGLNLDELAGRFDIYAEQSDSIIPFQKNMKINGLLIKKKKPKFGYTL